MTLAEIAVELDAAISTVCEALRRGPNLPREERSALMRHLWRDRVFGGEDGQIWTRERIVAAIRAWAKRTGEPPTSHEWARPNGARAFSARRASRPSSKTVIAHFGSWNAAIEAAGFAVRKGRPRRFGRCRNGHLVAEVGLRPNGSCAECSRIAGRAFYGRRKRAREVLRS
jgi:Homing endonuclease associated repeat